MIKNSNIMTINGQPAVVTFEADIGAFRGKFLNVNGYCDFVADSIEGLRKEGEISLAEWIADCEQDGITPFKAEEKQKSFTLRYPGALEARLNAAAQQHSVSKNQFIVDLLERELFVR